MTDARTLAVYDARADDYARMTNADQPDADLAAFIALLPSDAHVLDLGCGPATAAMHLRAAGHRPDPVDASPGMVQLANDTHQIGARLATFDDITDEGIYDAIWANFSLLHAPRDALPRHLAALAAALKPGGLFHIGMKTGTGTTRDSIDRLYTYVSVPELTGLLTDAGLTPFATREGRETGLSGEISPFVIIRARKHG